MRMLIDQIEVPEQMANDFITKEIWSAIASHAGRNGYKLLEAQIAGPDFRVTLNGKVMFRNGDPLLAIRTYNAIDSGEPWGA